MFRNSYLVKEFGVLYVKNELTHCLCLRCTRTNVFVHVCVCPLAWGGPEGGPKAFTRSASWRLERLEGDNNSQVKIQLFAWGLSLWGLSGRSMGGEGFHSSETEATCKDLLLLLSPLIVKIWKLPLQGRAAGQSDWLYPKFNNGRNCGGIIEHFVPLKNRQIKVKGYIR